MPDVPERPARLRLRRPHGFIDAGGVHRYWRAGQVVADAAEIATLVECGAPVEPVEG